MCVGENILKLRKRKKFTQKELAELVGVSHPRISEIEKGKANPTLSLLSRIADALETTVSRLTRETVSK